MPKRANSTTKTTKAKRQKPASSSSSSSSSSSTSSPPNAEKLQQKMLNLLQIKGKVDQDLIEANFRSLYGDNEKLWGENITQVINNLLRNNRIAMYQGLNNTVEYELQSQELADKLTGLTTEELQVLQEVRKGTNHGVWIRDLRYNTRLQKNRIEKILKRLTIVGLIKSVKSVASMNRRLYMLKDTVPSREISGGPWYTDSEFDEGFIGSLRTAIEQLIKGNDSKRTSNIGNIKGKAKTNNAADESNWSYMSTSDIHKQLVAFNLTETHLTADHIQEIVNTLVYDGQVMEVNAQGMSKSLNATLKSGTNKFYKMVTHPAAVNSWTNKYGQSYAQESDYTDAFGRGKMILFCKCGCGNSSGCGVASLSTEAYHARVLELRRRQMEEEMFVKLESGGGNESIAM